MMDCLYGSRVQHTVRVFRKGPNHIPDAERVQGLFTKKGKAQKIQRKKLRNPKTQKTN